MEEGSPGKMELRHVRYFQAHLITVLDLEKKPGLLPTRPTENLIRQTQNTIIIMRLAHCHISMCQAEILTN